MFCNICGKKYVTLERHHVHGRKGQNINNYILVCRSCHVKMHQFQNDFQRWGKLGAEIRGKKYGKTGWHNRGK